MKQKEYLPGKLCDRVRDLREEKGLTRKELAGQSGVNESLLGRIENNKNKKVSDEAVQALAKFFSVSTDFLLGLTDIPDRKNYDIEELGLSVQAARNLYTGAVNVQVVNLLLEDPQFAVLSNHVADFFDETMAAGYAARNQLYASVSEVVGRIGKEDAKLRGAARKTSKIVSSMTTPLYETELTQMQAEFRSIIVRLKKEFPSRVEEMKKLTREAFQNTVEHFTKGGEASQLMQVSEEEFAERFRQSLSYLPEISDRISDELAVRFHQHRAYSRAEKRMSDLEIKPYVPPEWKTISNEALCALAQAKNKHAMNVLIWRNEAFLAERARKVWNIAFKNTQEYSVDLDDLMQAAREGMWRAIIAFKPSYGTKLLTLAGICIENKLADLEREYFSDIKEEKTASV